MRRKRKSLTRTFPTKKKIAGTDFLTGKILGDTGKPEQLTGYKNIRYSLHVAPHVRLIIEPNANQDTVMICTEIKVEGVSDYHGSKENWYIP